MYSVEYKYMHNLPHSMKYLYTYIYICIFTVKYEIFLLEHFVYVHTYIYLYEYIERDREKIQIYIYFKVYEIVIFLSVCGILNLINYGIFF